MCIAERMRLGQRQDDKVRVRPGPVVCICVAVISLMTCVSAGQDTSWITAAPRSDESPDNQPCWIVVGRADANESNCQQLAAQDARQRALEAHFKARGIPAERLEKDTPKIQKVIAEHADTLFGGEQVTESCTRDGHYYALVRTQIRPGELAKWMFLAGADMQAFYKWWSSPSFLVTLDDDRARVCAQDCLLKEGFEVKSAAMRDEIARHSAEAYADQRKAVQQALARKYKSEIIVDGQCTLTGREPIEYQGQTVYAYDGTLRVEVIDAATANIIVSKEWTYRAKLDDQTTDFEQSEAMRKCQAKLLELHASSIVYEILSRYFDWKVAYNIQFLGVSDSARKGIVDCLKSISDLEFLSYEFDNGVMDVKARCTCDPESIIEKVAASLRFELRRKTRGVLIFGGEASDK